jgi:photosystem II stability/assembly factor-like uncharacterized protein
MTKHYTIIAAAICSVIISSFPFFLFPVTGHFQTPHEHLQESPLELKQWEHEKYADPVTGAIPGHALWKAYQQLMAAGKVPSGPFYSQTTRTNHWEPVNDFFSSIAITKITYDPQHTQTFYFCTGEGWYNADAAVGAGVWKSLDAGNSWAQLPATDTSTFDYCQDVDVHPFTSDVYVATVRTGLMRSKDGGNSFQRVLNVPGAVNNSICDVEFTKNGGVFATTGIFQTGAIYYSESGDSGTWIKQFNGFPTSGILRVELATAPSNDSVAYAVACNNTDYAIKGFYKTTNKGNSWTTISNPGGDLLFAKQQAWYDLILAVDPNDENTVVAGGWEQWRSKDGGSTWLRLGHGNPDSLAYQYLHVDEHAIVFRNSDTIYFGNDGGIYKSGDFTQDYPVIYERNLGYRVTQYYAGDIHPDAGSAVIIGGTQDNGSNKMVYGGISPYQGLSWGDGGFCAINQQNPAVMYTTKNSNGTYRFTNGGYGIPDTITNPYVTNGQVLFINPIILDPNNPDILYMATTNKGLWRLKNASTATDSMWQQASKNVGTISAMSLSKSQPNTMFIGKSSGGNIYRMENADTTTANHLFTDCDPNNNLPSGTFSSPTYCSCVYVDPKEVNHVFATYSNYGTKNVWESKNATSATPLWLSHDGDLPDLPVNWIFPHPDNPGVCYIGTDLGVFYTNMLNGDSTVWLPTNQGLANVRVNMLTYRESDHTLLAVTHGRGMFTGTVSLTGPDYSISWTERGPLDIGGRTRAIMIDPNDPTGQTVWAGSVGGGLWKTTSIDEMAAVGMANISEQNERLTAFPNPLNANGTTIQLSFSGADTNADLSVYDNHGQLISNLWQQKKVTPGIYKVHWVPESNTASGVYFICLSSAQGKSVIKTCYLR